MVYGSADSAVLEGDGEDDGNAPGESDDDGVPEGDGVFDDTQVVIMAASTTRRRAASSAMLHCSSLDLHRE